MIFKSPVNWALLLLTALTVASCSEEKVAPNQSPVEVGVVKVLQKDVPIYEDFVGQIYGYVDIPIRARVTGFLEGIHFEEGSRVEKGQLLYTIDKQPFLADVAVKMGQLAEATTEKVRAMNELNRYEPLIKTNAVSQSDYDATKAEAEAAQAAVEAAEANVEMAEINLGYCEIKSPINGLIGRTKAKVGEFVGKDPNPVILNTVSQISQVRVNFFLTESDYLRIAREMMEKGAEYRDSSDTASRRLTLILSDGSVHNYPGQVDFVNREVDASTGSMLVQSSFPNPNRLLRPGQYGKVRILMEMAENAMLIPQKCVQEVQGQYFVVVVNDSNVVETKQIKVGGRYNDYYLIESGIQADSKIIMEGIQKVRPGMKAIPSEVRFTSQQSEKGE